MKRKLPAGWELTYLKDITEEFISGGTPSTAEPQYWDGNIPWITSASIKAFYIDSGERFISREGLENSASHIVPKGNVIIATRVGIGKSAVNTIDVAINQDLTGIIIDKTKLLPQYLARFLLSPEVIRSLSSLKRGATIKGLKRTDLEEIEIPYSQLIEIQESIVEILDRTDMLRAKRRDALDKLDMLLTSLFLEMFGDPSTNPKGWEKYSIGELIEPVETWNPSSAISDEEFYYIDISSIDQSEKIIAAPKRLRCADAPSRARQLVRSGDVLVSTVRPNLNTVAVVPQELDGATASTGFCVLRPNKEHLVSQYLFAWVRSNAFISEMVRLATGASYPAVTDKIIYSSVLYRPPKSLQKKYACRVDAIERIKTAHRVSLTELDAFFASLESRAFRGEL